MTTTDGWPQPLGKAAYHGPLGEYVMPNDTNTQSGPSGDPRANGGLLRQRRRCNPHFLIQDTRHGTNLSVLIVGDTATARKGTSFDRAFAPVPLPIRPGVTGTILTAGWRLRRG